MTSPLSARRAEAASAARMARAMCAGDAVPCQPRVSAMAVSVVESARMLPTLRSMPPVRMTNVIASEMIPISEIWRRMSVRLPDCRKMREPSAAVGLISMASSTMPDERGEALRSWSVLGRSGGSGGHDHFLGGFSGII